MEETTKNATNVEGSTDTTAAGTEKKEPEKTGSGAVKTEEQIRAEVEAELKRTLFQTHKMSSSLHLVQKCELKSLYLPTP